MRSPIPARLRHTIAFGILVAIAAAALFGIASVMPKRYTPTPTTTRACTQLDGAMAVERTPTGSAVRRPPISTPCK